MASSLYPSFKQLLLGGDIDLTTADVRVVAVDLADYIFSSAHNFLNDVALVSRVSVSPSLVSKTIVSGVFDAADTQFASVTGDAFEALIFYNHTGTESTSNLIAFIDGFIQTPNGNNIDVVFNASGIFAL